MSRAPVTKPSPLPRHGLFWLASVGAFVLALWALKPVLLPFVAGAAIAYVLDPVVDALERRRVPRVLGTAIAILGFLAAVVLSLFLVVPPVQGQVARLVTQLPNLVHNAQDRLTALIMRLQASSGLPVDSVQSLTQSIAGDASQALGYVASMLGSVVQGSLFVVNLLSLIFVTPVVAFYFLRDWDHMVARIDGWLPRDQADAIRAQAREIDRTLSGFARGQALLCLVMAFYYAAGLSLAGLDFGLVVGVLSGILTFVPFVGALTAGVLSITLALLQFDHFSQVLALAGVFLFGQVLEGYVFQPFLVGDRVGLHPVWMIFALLAGGALFGVVGVLVAVPVVAVIGVLARYGLSRYLASSIYDPSRLPATPPSPPPSTRASGAAD